MPTLRYVVGSGADLPLRTGIARGQVSLLLPRETARFDRDSTLQFAWAAATQAALYRLEIESASGAPLLTALVAAPLATYLAPPFFGQRIGDAASLRWRVLALDSGGREVARSAWRALDLASAP